MHRFFMGWFVVWAMFWLAAPIHAGEYESLAIISGSSLDDATADIALLGETVQNPRLAENAGKALSRLARGAKLDGLDGTRRWAVTIRTDGIDLAPLMVLPVSDLDALLISLKPLLGEVQRREDGLIKIGRDALTGFIRERDGWAFVAQSADRLAELPDPVAILAETPPDALLAATLYVHRLPEAYRTMAIDSLREMIRAALQRRAPAAGAAVALSEDQSLTMLRTIEQGLADAGELRLATRIDRTTRTLTTEVRVRPREGSPWGKAVGQLAKVGPKSPAPPRDEALRFRAGWPLDAAGRAIWSERMQRYLPSAAPPAEGDPLKTAVALAAWLQKVAADVIQTNECRLDLVVVGERQPISLAARFNLSNAAAVEQAVQRWKELAAGQPAAPLPGDSKPPRAGAIRLRLSAADLPPALAKALGPDPSLWLAVEGDRAAIAAGPQADEALNRVFAKSANSAPLELSLRAGTCLSLLSQWSGNEQLRSVAPLVVLNLRSADDRVVFIAGRDGDDLLLRLTAHEGILHTAAFGLSVGILQVMSAP